MHKFEYVFRKKLFNTKQDLMNLINLVQNKVRKNFTFQYKFTGSSKYNMVTFIPNFNKGYDFDVDICLNSNALNYQPKEIVNKIKNALDSYNPFFNYDFTESSTSVLTIKVKDKKNSKILYSVDFAMIFKDKSSTTQYIRYDKKKQCYEWQLKPEWYYELESKIYEIKQEILWNEVRKKYLNKKNENVDNNKKSYSLFLETINEIYQWINP
ncbi:MAG: hypothetical protein K2H56_02210 [Malacoplasma sp.]|nr:hypothetical protein [Malacoplasma sp.]MDE5774980.1 hypothetical protein [Malacoplasma sp.]